MIFYVKGVANSTMKEPTEAKEAGLIESVRQV